MLGPLQSPAPGRWGCRLLLNEDQAGVKRHERDGHSGDSEGKNRDKRGLPIHCLKVWI